MNCESCGMPMEGPEQHGGGDPENAWCVHCSNKDGSRKTREQVREGLAGFMLTQEGRQVMKGMGQEPPADREAAMEAAEAYMKKMPAWRD